MEQNQLWNYLSMLFPLDNEKKENASAMFLVKFEFIPRLPGLLLFFTLMLSVASISSSPYLTILCVKNFPLKTKKIN